MKWSQQAWQSAGHIFEAILDNPFVMALADGSLPRDKFEFYLCQDSLYLNSYSSVLAHIASRCSKPAHREQFLRFAADGVAVEKALHESFLHAVPPESRPSKSPACLLYTSLLKSQALNPLELEVASVLPCFWIYNEVGHAIYGNAAIDNPYIQWINTYSDPAFDKSTAEAIAICDDMADAASDEVRRRMTDIFVLCAKMEWLFWQSAWEMEKWKI